MSNVQVVARRERDRLGEGLLWSEREKALFWTDILGRKLHRLDPASGTVNSWSMPDHVGWVIERQGGGFVAGVGRAFVALTLEPFAVQTIAAPEPEVAGNRFNDAKADAAGRIWAGSMPISCEGETGAFYRLDADGRAVRVDAPYTIPNGPAIAPDGRSMFHTDTALSTIFRYSVNDDGTLGPRVPHIVFDQRWGSPDGMTLDAEGCLWVACWGGSQLLRFTPEGRRERAIALPASQITNCTFAGDALDRLFVTSAGEGVDEELGGALFEVDPGCRGLPAQMYAG